MSGEPFETTFPVRYAETDQMGIVHHATYIIYCEEGRSAMCRARGRDYADMERAGFGLALMQLEARYLAPAHYGEQITVRTWIDEVRSRTITFGYEILAAATRQVLVTARTQLVCVRTDGKVASIPPDWRAFFLGEKTRLE